MPTDINVADGKLADWHRFDAKSTAVVKDRSVLMSNADSADNAREQIKTIWEKVGGTDTPPRVISFNREDLGANRAGQVPAAPPEPVMNSRTTTSLTINLSFVNSLGGSAPTSVDVRAVSGGTTTQTTNFTWPWPTTATVSSLTAGTSYDVSYRYSNSFGASAYSVTKAMTTLVIGPLIFLSTVATFLVQ